MRRALGILGLVLVSLLPASRAGAKYQPLFGLSYAISQPYPYNALTFEGVYQHNLFSNLSLEYTMSPYWALTAALGTDVLRWDKDQWSDPSTNTVYPGVYLDTWHYMGGVKIYPWGEVIVDDFWRVSPFFTAEGGILNLQAVNSPDTLHGESTYILAYEATAPMVGGGLGFEIGPPGENEDNDLLRFFSRNIRLFAGLKYFVGFTPYNLQYFPLQFGLKLRI